MAVAVAFNGAAATRADQRDKEDDDAEYEKDRQRRGANRRESLIGLVMSGRGNAGGNAGKDAVDGRQRVSACKKEGRCNDRLGICICSVRMR